MRLGVRLLGRRALATALLALAVSISGCSMALDATTLGVRTTLSSRATEQPEGEPFRVTTKTVYLLWGVGAAARPNLEHVLAGQITSQSSIANLRVSVKSNVGDLLVTILTAGLIVPRSITYEGVVVGPSTPTGR